MRPPAARSAVGRRWALGAAASAVVVALAFAAARAEDAGAPPPAPPKPLSPTVRILFQTVPAEKAEVRTGRKVLGLIKGRGKPLILERPRDSGPLDVTVRAEGYLPVHTRAYTFTDSKVFVKITKEEDKHTLFGYRAELPPEPDGGVPAVAGTASAPGATGPRGDAGVPPP